MIHFGPEQFRDGKWYYTCNGVAYGDCKNHDGHATKEEACECYKQMTLREQLRLDGEIGGQQLPCEQCKAEGKQVWTQKYAGIGAYRRWMLCDEHRNKDTVEKLYEVGESWQS